MKIRFNVAIGFLVVLSLVACASSPSSTPAQAEIPTQPVLQAAESPIPPASSPTETQPPATQAEVLPTDSPSEVPQSIATSRGPDLEATDPSTVSLASGELQLVEFFRFT